MGGNYLERQHLCGASRHANTNHAVPLDQKVLADGWGPGHFITPSTTTALHRVARPRRANRSSYAIVHVDVGNLHVHASGVRELRESYCAL